VALERLRAVLEYEDAPTPQVEKFLYGDLVYVPELKRLAWLDGAEGSAGHRARRRPVATMVCGWEEPNPEVIQEPSLALEDPMRELRILREFDFVEIAEDEDNPNDLRVQYAFGEQRVSIQQIVQARLQGLPYLETETGWIDLAAPELRGLESFIRSDATTSETLSLSSAQILRLRSSTDKPVHVGGSRDRSQILRRLLDFQPSTPLGELEGMTSALRPYQKIGVEWLNFLYENELAGLLCDDMGLGKTHQAMALMLLLREQHGVDDPFLVICPRTVISHWRDKLAQHAPGLRVAVYHGTNRNLEESLEDRDVLVASYGVLRNDAAKLGTVSWSLLIFDEIQQIKNQETQAHRAAVTVAARMKIGLTGTPIENSLNEIKNLFDLVLPGYLGDDESYFDRFGASSRDYPDDEALRDLRRLISPFVLRRLKTAVLDELPGKIEDIRTCSLSAEQHQLYRDAIDSRGLALADKIRRDDKPLPYIHIFALLNQLKQICDHPALALGEASEWREHDSQKWDLFRELLAESLESGQKVVVFSQYLGMIAMMESYLDELGIGYATLTGSTRRRGEVVDRFNTNPKCRVFLGSLRAGGTGIDLIAGSVVIHYDRWWNAAKEDQATDRVYRIGQRRAVQVFKLVTEDTLEERIAAMIDRKRDLMSSVVQADHPQLGKIFTREELLELLRQVD
jgi:SNF2 family DNA or RNA helicase